MAKKSTKVEKQSFTSLKDKISSNKFRNYYIFLNEAVLFNELIKSAKEHFISKEASDNDVTTYFSDDGSLEKALADSSNMGFFTSKKIVIYKIVKKPGYRGFTQKETKGLLDYFNNTNHDTLFIIWDSSAEPNYNNADDFTSVSNLNIAYIGEPSESEIIRWVKEKFEGISINEDTIRFLLQFVNSSFDELSQEIEKLKTFCLDSNEITRNDISQCIGLSKNSDEYDLVHAVLKGDFERSVKIYEQLILRTDIEIYTLVLLNSAFTAIARLKDPASSSMGKWDLIKNLKLWGQSDEKIQLYRQKASKINEFNITKAFDYIYQTEKQFKTSVTEKRTVFINLLYHLSTI